MIHLEEIQREHCADNARHLHALRRTRMCRRLPADAIKRTSDGVVQSSLKPRCIGCTNCVFACPFGVPKYDVQADQMMKCDMCYDRTSAGKKPMCATVCPSAALFFGTAEEIAAQRTRTPVNEFIFGERSIKTKVFLMMPKGSKRMAVKSDCVIRKAICSPHRG